MSFKKLIQFVFTLILFIGTYQSVLAQNFQNIVTSSLSYGNIKELTRSFDKRVQVTIDNKTDYFSNSQAEIIVNNYVDQLGNKDFNMIKSGHAEGGSAEFYIGEIKCTKGSVKVYIYLRKVAETPYIQEIRLEKN
ncbi:MAG: DUF4783 domain-containing protein [Chitinophagales bacterium]|nr:DUF4783 domain-containing protein [Chitinophagales bacterium]